MKAKNSLVADLSNAASPKGGHSSVAGNMIKTSVYRETLRLQYTYDDETVGGSPAKADASSSSASQSSLDDLTDIYILKQDTTEALIFDFNTKKFVKKALTQKIPVQAKSLQTKDGNIFVVGGLCRNLQNNENQVLKDCFKIDKQMLVTQQAKMETARFGSPLALIHGRFILALGGFANTGDSTTECEAYDTATNHWFQISPLPFPMANTTPVVVSNQHVYLMPGKQTKKSQLPPCLRLSVLDCGPLSSLRGSPLAKEYGYPLVHKNWSYIEVTN